MFILLIVEGQYLKKILYLSLFLGCFELFSQAQILDLSFRKLSLEAGLSQSNVTAILKDQQGFIWAGTQNGLNRYDAYQFQSFTSLDGLKEGYVSTLFQSRDGRIWIGNTLGSINILDPVSMELSYVEVPFPEKGSKGILRFYEDAGGKIWISSRTGVHVYDVAQNRFFHFSSTLPQLAKTAVYGIIGGRGDKLWVACQSGIQGLEEIRFTEAGEIQAQLIDPPKKYTYLANGLVFKIVPSKDGGMWLNAWKKGLIYFHPEQEEYRFYPISLDEENGEAVEVFEIAEDRDGYIWGTTKNHGLLRLNPETADLAFARYDAKKSSSLGSNTLMGLCLDSEGAIWVGSYGAGVNYHDPNSSNFKHIRADDAPLGLSNPLVYSIHASRYDQTLWVGTHGGGLNRIADRNASNPGISHHLAQKANPYSLKDEVVISLEEDEAGNLWVGSYQGLSILMRKDMREQGALLKFEGELGDSKAWNELEKAAIWAMRKDSKGRMWLGTNKGLYRKDKGVENFLHFRHKPNDSHSLVDDYYLRRIYEDEEGGIWISTSKGLHKFREKSQDFEVFTDKGEKGKVLSSASIFCVQQDRKGRIWVGTQGSGLNVIIRREEEVYEIVHFFETDGLPSNLVMGLLADETGQIWGSSSKGLFRFHPDSLLTNRNNSKAYFRLYDSFDGLQSNEFLEGAFAKDQEGYFYFGGVKGYNRFRPADFREEYESLELYLSKLKVLNEELGVGESLREGEVPLEIDLPYKKELNLSWRDYFFSIEFTALNYQHPEKTKYAYRVDGLHQEWIELGNQRSISFSNLDPGDYKLRIKASQIEGVWNQAERQLDIHISSPPWKTWWAYCLYGLAFLGLISAYIRFQLRQREKELETKIRIEEAKQEERELVRKNTAADFHDELGNKMTKISLFLELAKRAESANENLQLYLRQVEENTQILSQGIRDFIWVLDPDKDSLYDILIRIKDFGDELFAYTDISFSCVGIHPEQTIHKLSLNARRHMMLIAKEAMNNALKYAEASRVSCRTKVEGENFCLEIADDGKGFNSEKVKQGYGLKNIRDRAKKIGANAEIISEEGKGSCVRLTFSLTHMGD
ncbi:MAG: two-component regulator propeller domain-containing protein [Bacteroidota bacterium]